jgi:hypothetical protein
MLDLASWAMIFSRPPLPATTLPQVELKSPPPPPCSPVILTHQMAIPRLAAVWQQSGMLYYGAELDGQTHRDVYFCQDFLFCSKGG